MDGDQGQSYQTDNLHRAMDKLAVLLLFPVRFCHGISCKAACRHTPITHTQLLYVSTGVQAQGGHPKSSQHCLELLMYPDTRQEYDKKCCAIPITQAGGAI
jgi:hypothetical protein